MARSDKESFELAKRRHRAESERQDELRKQFEFGASDQYRGEQFRQDLSNLGIVDESVQDDVLDFEEVPAESTNLGEIAHTPVRDQPHTPAVVNELQESPIVDAIVLDDEPEGRS